MTTVGKQSTETDYYDKEKDIEKEKRKLLEILEEQVKEVDRNVKDLAESFDTLYANLRGKSEDLEWDIVPHEQDKDDGDKHMFSRTQEIMSNTIASAEAVNKNKVKAIKSLSKLIHFIHADREEISTNQSLESCKVLAIDTYLKSCPSSDQNGDALIEMLEEQNKRLQQKYLLSREHAKIISEREKIVNAERNHLREQLKKLRSKMKTQMSTTSAHDKLICDNAHYAENKRMDGSYDIKRECDKDKDDVNDPYTTTDVTDASSDTENGMLFNFGGVDSELGTIITKQNYSVENIELVEAKQQISNLNVKLQDSRAEIKDLSQALVFGEVLEVALVHTREVSKYHPEKELEQLLRTGMTKYHIQYDLKVVQSDAIAQQDRVSILCCAASSLKEWGNVLEEAVSYSMDYKLTFIVLFYDMYDEWNACEDAQERNCQVLEKFVRVFSIPCISSGYIYYKTRDALIREIITAIVEKAVYKRKAIGCIHCKTPSSTVKTEYT